MPATPRRTRMNRILLALAAAWVAIALAIGGAAADAPLPRPSGIATTDDAR
jgi:hypothetical protein